MRSAVVARVRQALTAGRAYLTRQLEADVWRKWLRWIWIGLAGMLFAILGLIVWRNRASLLESFRTARYEYFVLTAGAYLVSIGAVAFGWHLLMHHLGGESRLLLNLKIYVYTLAARRLPGSLWYIAGRSALYRCLGVSGRVSALASGIEVILSIVSGLMVGAPALFLQIRPSPVGLVGFVCVELVGLSLLHPVVLRWILARLGHHVVPGRLTIPRALSWLGAYTAMWISGGLMTCTVVRALHPLAPHQALWTISLWALTGAVSFLSFLLPSSIGASEIVLSVLLSRIVPLHVAVASAILLRVLTTAIDIGWAILFLWEKKTRVGSISWN